MLAPSAHAQKVDHLGLAALLIRDAHYDRAQNHLSQVDPDEEGADRVRYFSLSGLLALEQSQYTKSIGHLEKALAEARSKDNPEDVDAALFLYLAQAHFGAQQFQKSLQALDGAGALAEGRPSSLILRSACNWRLQQYSQAWQALSEGQRQFPGFARFDRQKILYLLELGLYQQAGHQVWFYLKSPQRGAHDYIEMAKAFRRQKQFDLAVTLVEAARLKFPNVEKIYVELAHNYLKKNMTLAAAETFYQASAINRKFLVEAAELFRRAGKTGRALYLNAMIHDQKEKLKQRLAILLEAERFEQASSMETSLSRAGLLDDENIRYALAYTLFQTGEMNRVESHLQHLRQPDLFQKALALREAIVECEQDRWACVQL